MPTLIRRRPGPLILAWRPRVGVAAALVGAAVNDGLALVAGGAGHRVDFAFTGTNLLTISPTISPSAGSLGAITADTDTTAHATYTPPATAQTITFTCTSHTGTAQLTVVAASTGYSLSGPSTGAIGAASTNFTVTVTPTGSAVETAVTVTPAIAPDGSVSGTVLLAARTVNASGTFTVTPAAGGAHTVSTSDNGGLTDPSSLTYTAGAVPGSLGDANLRWSPYNWLVDGSRKIANNIGAWVEFATTDADVAVEIDYTEHIAASHQNDSSLSIGYTRNDGVKLTANTYGLTYASGLAKITLGSSLTGTTRIRLWIENLDGSIDRWVTPVQALRITRFCRVSGADLANTSAHPRTRANHALWYGDSITELEPMTSFPDSVSRKLDAYVGRVGFRGGAWQAVAGGGVPRFYQNGVTTGYWSNHWSGHPRTFSPAPTYVILHLGINDILSAVSAATIQTAATQWLAECRAAVGSSAWIFLVSPLRTNYDAAYAAAAATDSKAAAIAWSSDLLAHFLAASIYTTDGIHPNAGGEAQMAGEIADRVRAAITPASGGGGGSRRRPQ